VILVNVEFLFRLYGFLAKQYKVSLKAALLLMIKVAKVTYPKELYNSQLSYYAGNQKHSPHLKGKITKKN
jgi:hypothetical protein